jgi:hypothetical protein
VGSCDKIKKKNQIRLIGLQNLWNRRRSSSYTSAAAFGPQILNPLNPRGCCIQGVSKRALQI